MTLLRSVYKAILSLQKIQYHIVSFYNLSHPYNAGRKSKDVQNFEQEEQ